MARLLLPPRGTQNGTDGRQLAVVGSCGLWNCEMAGRDAILKSVLKISRISLSRLCMPWDCYHVQRRGVPVMIRKIFFSIITFTKDLFRFSGAFHGYDSVSVRTSPYVFLSWAGNWFRSELFTLVRQ